MSKPKRQNETDEDRIDRIEKKLDLILSVIVVQQKDACEAVGVTPETARKRILAGDVELLQKDGSRLNFFTLSEMEKLKVRRKKTIMQAKRQPKEETATFDLNEYMTDGKTTVCAINSREDFSEFGIFKGDLIFYDSTVEPKENDLILTASRRIAFAAGSRKSFKGLYLAAKNGRQTAFLPQADTLGVIVGMCRKFTARN